MVSSRVDPALWVSFRTEDTVTHKHSKRSSRTQARPLTDRELEELWAEVQAADEADAAAGDVADLPEGVPLPEEPGQVVAVFFRRRDGDR
jgi:hypothetical protein